MPNGWLTLSILVTVMIILIFSIQFWPSTSRRTLTNSSERLQSNVFFGLEPDLFCLWTGTQWITLWIQPVTFMIPSIRFLFSSLIINVATWCTCQGKFVRILFAAGVLRKSKDNAAIYWSSWTFHVSAFVGIIIRTCLLFSWFVSKLLKTISVSLDMGCLFFCHRVCMNSFCTMLFSSSKNDISMALLKHPERTITVLKYSGLLVTMTGGFQ